MAEKKKPAAKSAPKSPFNGDGPVRLSLACGDRKPEGFYGVDVVKTEAADFVQDLMQFPWSQFPDNSVDEIEVSHFVEHIPHGDGYHDPFFQFFDEIYRILKPAEFDPTIRTSQPQALFTLMLRTIQVCAPSGTQLTFARLASKVSSTSTRSGAKTTSSTTTPYPATSISPTATSSTQNGKTAAKKRRVSLSSTT